MYVQSGKTYAVYVYGLLGLFHYDSMILYSVLV